MEMRNHNKICEIIKLMRPQSVFLMLLLIYIPIVIETKDYGYGFVQILPFYLLITGEIILNDYQDVEKDKINKPHRPLAKGKISLQLAKYLFNIFISMSLVGAIICYNQSFVRIVFFFAVFGILTSYSVYLKKIALVKTFITALTTVICLCFVFSYYELKVVRVYYSVVAFFYISSRELLMDIRDYAGDKQCGCITLAVLYGQDQIYKLASFLMLISQLAYLILIIPISKISSRILWLIAVLIIVISFLKFKISNSKKQNMIIILLWIPILLSLLNIW